MGALREYCIFHVADMCFGVEVHEVREVVRYVPIADVPLSPEVVGGLINLRGEIITAIDLRSRLVQEPFNEDAHPMNVVVHTEAGPVSLLVDRIAGVISADMDQFEPPHSTLGGIARELIRGAYKLPNGLVLVLDTERAAAVKVRV